MILQNYNLFFQIKELNRNNEYFRKSRSSNSFPTSDLMMSLLQQGEEVDLQSLLNGNYYDIS